MAAKYLHFVIIVSCLWNTTKTCPNASLEICPDGFILLNQKCYYFSIETGSWVDGIKFCRNHNSDLLSIESYEESKAINFHLHNKHSSKYTSYWTSGSDLHETGKYVWKSEKPFFFKNWCNDEPNYKNEHCVQIHLNSPNSRNPCWNDASCSSDNHFICESDYDPRLVGCITGDGGLMLQITSLLLIIPIMSLIF